MSVTIANQLYRAPLGADPVTWLLGLAACTGPTRRWDRDVAWPIEGERHAAAWLLAWGGRPYPPGLGPHVSELQPLPATDPARARWFDQVAFREVAADVAGVWTELLRTEQLAPGLARCERIVTYLRVIFLDAGGQPVGEFRTQTDTDPALSQIVHPDPAVLPLELAWALVADQPNAQVFYTGPEDGVPGGLALDGVPVRWRDLRYSWGSRYTMSHTIVVPNGSRLRLFVGLTTRTPDRYRVTAGGQLGGIVSTDSPAALRIGEST